MELVVICAKSYRRMRCLCLTQVKLHELPHECRRHRQTRTMLTSDRVDNLDADSPLRLVFWHSLALATLMGVFVMLQAYVFKGMVVVPPVAVP